MLYVVLRDEPIFLFELNLFMSNLRKKYNISLFEIRRVEIFDGLIF